MSARSRLEKAVEKVSASAIPSGDYAYYDDAMRCYYVVDSRTLEELTGYLESDDPAIAGDAYSHWCAGSDAEQMPDGWTPDTASE